MTVTRSLMIAASLVVFATTMTGCDVNRVERSESFTATYEIVKVNPPKHFYLDLRDVKTGKVYKQKYISKRCNKWKETAVVGKTYNLTVKRRFFTNGATDLRFTPSRKIFCGY